MFTLDTTTRLGVRVRNIARNPRVSLNLRGDERADEIAIFIGDATTEDAEPSPETRAAYLAKYAAPIARLGYTAEGFERDYSVPIRVTPEKLRGF